MAIMIDKNLLGQIAQRLHSLAKDVETAAVEGVHTVSIPLQAIRDGYPAEQLAELNKWSSARAPYIYKFSVNDDVYKNLYQAFSNAKKDKQIDRAFARLNAESPLLYVGSSQSLNSRIKQHLGFGAKGTYAMQICHWLPKLEGELHIQAWKFGANTQKSVVQAIEDGLWAASSPMFGRQGAL